MDEPRPRSLGERLLWARDVAGYTLAGLAAAADLSVTRLRQLEGDPAASPATDTLERLGSALAVHPAWLAWGVGPEPVALEVRAAVERARSARARSAPPSGEAAA